MTSDTPRKSALFAAPATGLGTRPRFLHRLGGFATMLLLSATPAWAEPPAAVVAEPVRVLAAGSLGKALTEIIARWHSLRPDHPVSLERGPAGWLRERIEQGHPFDLYASAALSHAEALNREGWTGPPVLFARNRLCAQVKADSPLTSDTLVDSLLAPSTRIATSTPKLDPGGDYAWEFFRRLDRLHPGAFAALTTRAQQIYGKPPDPARRPPSVSALIAADKIDIALGYCSGMLHGADGAVKGIPLPAPAPIADYALAVSPKALAATAEFALFVLSPQGQCVLADNGFLAVGLPSDLPCGMPRTTSEGVK